MAMNIQWYPGHMTKAKRAMEADIKLVDVLIEIRDARVPESSRNPDVVSLGQGKQRILILNKADLADPKATENWKASLEREGYLVVTMDARKNASLKEVRAVLDKAAKIKKEKDQKRGILNRPTRIMVLGIPNVGKSTLINSLAGRASTKTGDKPGVTKGNQWIRLNQSLEVLDTPGILWPKFDDETVGLHLALIGSINDEILTKYELAAEGLRIFGRLYPEKLLGKYGFTETDPYKQLEELARKQLILKKGGEPDAEKAAVRFIDDLRKGRIGSFTLELPEKEENHA